jgi:hypothetical protein
MAVFRFNTHTHSRRHRQEREKRNEWIIIPKYRRPKKEEEENTPREINKGRKKNEV